MRVMITVLDEENKNGSAYFFVFWVPSESCIMILAQIVMIYEADPLHELSSFYAIIITSIASQCT